MTKSIRTIKIRNRHNGEIIYESAESTILDVVKKAHKEGVRLYGANLCGAYLDGADLRDAYLCTADLSGAYLDGANLARANLCGAYLYGADLRGANLFGADLRIARLSDANLGHANLSGANLGRADLFGANLCGADFRDADLSNTDLGGADLRGTCLDPTSPPTGALSPKWEHLKCRDGTTWVRGWRTKNSVCVGNRVYRSGDLVEAPVFSTANTECHPGIYLWPTKELAVGWGRPYHYNDDYVVSVLTRPWEIHEVGDKSRARWVIVG